MIIIQLIHIQPRVETNACFESNLDPKNDDRLAKHEDSCAVLEI